MKKYYMFLSAALLLFTASCSNDENNNEQKEPTQAVQFSFTNEEFGEDETLTRSAETAKPQIVDLGDCEAEISVESEPAAKTRGAKTPANGHYTIRAYQAGTLKGEMKGTFSAGTFTPDASSPKDIVIPAGTYDFIAFNDDVTPSGTNLTTTRNKAETARMGFATQVITATPQKQQVMFTMKHVGCRLRTQFLCQKDIPNAITATLEQATTNVIPTSVAYNPVTKSYTGTPSTIASETNNSSASTEAKYTASNYGQNYSYTSTSDYHYFLPTTEGSKLKLTGISAGTVFWKPIPTFNVPNLNATLQMQAGKSYAVKIKFKPNYTYLMSDGTTGHFTDTTLGGGTKTPIAVVVKENSGAAQSGIAVALHNANGGNPCTWGPSYKPGNNSYHNPSPTTTDSGYDLTWGSTLSYGGIIKGNDTSFPAFYHAGHYNPGVSVTGLNISKWYLPAGGDFSSFLRNLEWGNENYGFGWRAGYGNLMNQAFTRVGGTAMISTTHAYWVATEGRNLGFILSEAHTRAFLDNGMYCSYASKGNLVPVRSFVRY